MALQLAPWLQPPDYLRSIDSGAQIGLGMRRNDLEQAAQVQRARQAQAELQQNWAAKMMANQTAQQDSASRDALAQQQFGLRQDQNRLTAQNQLNTDAHNQALEDISAAGVKQREAAAAAALAASQNKPMHLGAGSTVVNPQTGEVLYSVPPKERTVNPLSDIQNTQLTDLQAKTAPVVSSGFSLLHPIDTFGTKITNAPPPLSLSDQANLNFLQNRKDAFIRQNQTPTPFPMQTNSLAPAADAWLGEGNTGNNPPQLAPPLSLTNSPAGGTGQFLKPDGTLSNDGAANFLKSANGDVNKARQMAKDAGYKF